MRGRSGTVTGAWRPAPRIGAGIAVVLAALVAVGCGDAQRFGGDDPRSAVGRLLVLSVGQANGAKACAMLTRELREELDAGPAGDCRRAMGNVTSLLPGERDEATSFEQVTSGLTFTKEEDGDAATVRVVGRGADVSFDLKRLPDGEPRGADGGDPDTPWRIATGVEQLLGGGSATRTATEH
ncbi:MAG: hypothetical protein AB7G37_12675 [Solirubrobacteraceae bacterium]